MAYKPYKVKKNPDIYAKYEKKNDLNSPKYDNVKIFGFRSGASYKMIPAMLYYLLAAYVLGSSIYGEVTNFQFTKMDVLLMILKYIFIFIAVYSPLIFLSDFKYRNSIPLFKKHQASYSIIGIVLVIFFSYFMMQVYIFCMSDTYVNSVTKYEKQLELEQQKSMEEMETNTKESVKTDKTMYNTN